MNYYYLDAVKWQHSQALYHAMAYLGREALIILRPATPYVCIGYHQDAQQEIDLDFAAQQGIPVFRREVGGGAVYLDGAQLFFQFILDPQREGMPSTVAGFYQKYLQPVIATFRDFGVPAEYRPVNDVIAGSRKISGTGAAQIGERMVLVGNFIQDFNYEMMSKLLRVPDEKFRDKVYKTMSENLTTFLRETGRAPANDDLKNALIKHCEPLLGEMEPRVPDAELLTKADELIAEMHTPEWLLANDKRRPKAAEVKISEGVYVIQKVAKLPGGLVRITAVSQEGVLHDAHISGDFFFFPSQKLPELEAALEGQPLEADALARTVSGFYQRNTIDSPGILPQDWVSVLVGQ